MTVISAVVVAFGDQPELRACLDALLNSCSRDVDVIVVDNGDTTGIVAEFADRAGVKVIDPGRNTGFAEGCNLGVAAAGGAVIALVNPDVVVLPGTLERLAAVAIEPTVGLATASVRLADQPETVNTVGNPVHFSGLAWAGGHGEPASDHAVRRQVASASGACCAIRRAVWDELGGFEPVYFAYHEDVELSLRCRLHGYEVVYVPDAVATHRYDFGRNARKNELLERNRWLTLLRIYSLRSLVLLSPGLLLVDLLIVALAVRQRWLGAKIAGYRWLWRHRAEVLAGRRLVQSGRRVPDRELAAVLTGQLRPTNVEPVPGLSAVSTLLAGYWAIVRRML
jgi:GT2 family glycosyltransferase